MLGVVGGWCWRNERIGVDVAEEARGITASSPLLLIIRSWLAGLLPSKPSGARLREKDIERLKPKHIFGPEKVGVLVGWLVG